LVHKWLNRRSQRRSYHRTKFDEAWERWKIPSPQIFEKPWPQARQNHPHPVENVTHPSPIMIEVPLARIPEEPGAAIPHAGICEGVVRQLTSLP
jgi:hypothetical protein